MTRRISDKSKQILHMGEGKGKDYVPYILTSEFNSLGTTSIITDWKPDVTYTACLKVRQCGISCCVGMIQI